MPYKGRGVKTRDSDPRERDGRIQQLRASAPTGQGLRCAALNPSSCSTDEQDPAQRGAALRRMRGGIRVRGSHSVERHKRLRRCVSDRKIDAALSP
jgi:hypothetical protein